MSVVFRKSVKPHVSVIQFNVPEKLNAMSVEVGERFRDCVKQAKEQDDLRCLIVAGDSDNKAFSAGGDLAFLEARRHDSPSNNSKEMLKYYARFTCLRDVEVPIIASMNGAAVGAGMCLALMADLRICADSSKLGVNFSRLGIHCGLGSSHFMPQLLGYQQAANMLLRGHLIDAEEAVRIGLVLKSFPKEQVFEKAIEMAQDIALCSPLAVQQTLKTLRAQSGLGLEKALQREADSQSLCYAHKDLAEGLEAVKSKRQPKFD